MSLLAPHRQEFILANEKYVNTGNKIRDGCWIRILIEFLSLKSMVVTIARISWGRKSTVIITNITSGWFITMNPMITPLDINARADATIAIKNLLFSKPSRGPLDEMVLATPTFRHLARPKEAENTELENVMKNKTSAWRSDMSPNNMVSRPASFEWPATDRVDNFVN